MSEAIYDCIIIGGGPAGLAAALYAGRDRFKTVILEKFFPGGQINNTDKIENFPGFEQISGPDLIAKQVNQATNFGVEIKTGSEVTGLKKLDDGNIEVSCDEEKFVGRAVILTPGSDYRKLGVPGEDEFRSAGTGVSYCGTCDAPFYTDKKVVSVGGGNTAVEETIHLAKFAAEVTIVHRRQEFRASKVLTEELMEHVEGAGGNIKLKLDCVVEAIEGAGKVESAKIKDVKTGKVEDVACDGVFIFVGTEPNTGFLKGSVDLTDHGFIKCDSAYLRTAVPGVFVAGDCRVGAAMQLATAVGDGVLAAIMMKQYFRDPNWWNEEVTDTLLPGGW